MALDLTNLNNAIDALERSVNTAETLDKSDPFLTEVVRAGVIQQFEVAYEQSWKMIRRWLRENYSIEEAEFPRTRKELFRHAARAGLIEHPENWFSYGDARNLSTNTYNQARAEEVYKTALTFLKDARRLQKNLESLSS